LKAVAKAVSEVQGVTAKCDQDAETVTLTATDDAAAQKGLDALAAAGFHGTTGNDKLTIKDDSGVKPGKVKSLEVTGVHNCCGSCTTRIKKALNEVSGATSSTVQKQERTFTVEGDFEAADLVKTLNAAGFHVKVK
jgi:copper chaperone CopZ